MITEKIKYIGVDDKEIDLFENQYVVPNGVSYNSYVILDEKVVIMDTVDAKATERWLQNLQGALDGRKPDYLVISHMEPDHSGSIEKLIAAYPELILIGNAKTFPMLENFLKGNLQQERIVVKEGDTITLGKHILQFFMAPMVHWPEVMVTYEQTTGILFSADGFGKFGTLDTDEDWISEARRYYFNIVGKYGAPVQSLLKKAAALDIRMICPLHGPVLRENLEYYIGKYNTWSSYQPEERGILVAYASIHGSTAAAAGRIAELLREAGEEKVVLTDLSRADMADAVEDAFRYDRMILAASSYDGGLFLPMEFFLLTLKSKAYQNRTVALIENGSWAPCAAKKMREYLDTMKNVVILENTITILSGLKPETESSLRQLADCMKNR